MMQNSHLRVKILGDFHENLPTSQEYLRIQFSPSSLSLQQRWRNNGLSADFMADYLTTFFSQHTDQSNSINPELTIKNAISFIANELLENAMKFSDESSHHPTTIALHLLSDRLIFLATNSISRSSQERLQAFIHLLLSSNPEELYFQHLEKLEEASSTSGLGLLTMMKDYLAQVGWKFERLDQDPAVVTVTTMVQLHV